MTIGKRIKQARTMQGLNQRELADRIGLSATSVSKYETGKVKPDSSVLIQVARALGMHINYFLRPQRVGSIEPAYRKRASMGKKAERRLTESIRDWLERYITAEELSAGHEVDFSFPEGFPKLVREMEDVEEAAVELRHAWDIGIDPIENLVSTLEDKGIKIGTLDADDDFDACTFTADVNGGVPVVVLHEDRPGDRQRFTLAHELGHVMLKVQGGIDVEDACNRFAGAFLAPAPTLKADTGAHRKAFSLEELELLKVKYGMSMQALVYRAMDLGIIPKQYARRVFKNFRVRGWHKNEPGADVHPEDPQRFRMMVLRLLSENIISARRAEELLDESLDDDAYQDVDSVPA